MAIVVDTLNLALAAPGQTFSAVYRAPTTARGTRWFESRARGIVDEQGRLRLRLRTMGPLLYLKLPTGHYQLNAAYRGAMHAVTLTAGPKPVDMILRLPAVPGPDEWLLCKTGCSRVTPRAPLGARGGALRSAP